MFVGPEGKHQAATCMGFFMVLPEHTEARYRAAPDGCNALATLDRTNAMCHTPTLAAVIPSPKWQPVRQPVEPRRYVARKFLTRHDVTIERHGEAAQYQPHTTRRHCRCPRDHDWWSIVR